MNLAENISDFVYQQKIFGHPILPLYSAPIMSSNENAARVASRTPSHMSDADSVDRGTLSDQEKQEIPELNSDDGLLVEWDGENDPLSPRNFSTIRKWFIVSVIAAGSFLV